MKTETFAVLAILAGLFIGGAFAEAAAIPGIPNQFFGSVNSLNGPAPDGTLVEAKIGNITIASTVTSNGLYGSAQNLFLITDPDNNMTGKNISFYVAGDSVASAAFASGQHTKLDLSVNKNLWADSSSSQSNDNGVNTNANKDNKNSETPAGIKTLTFFDNASSIKISINLKRAIVNPSLFITLLPGAPETAPQQPVYQYMNVIEKNFANADIDSATVEFRVSRRWITDNNITAVYILRYDNSWNKLQTELTGSTADYNSYKAYTNAFSYLAIAGEKAPAQLQPQQKTGQQAANSSANKALPTGSFLGSVASTTWVGIILLLAVIVLYGYRTKEKRKEMTQ
ncbi:Uncharacterised protein [uncultured archaeon]|nr:Uncharacterised protein [uncultured archaeon]